MVECILTGRGQSVALEAKVKSLGLTRKTITRKWSLKRNSAICNNPCAVF